MPSAWKHVLRRRENRLLKGLIQQAVFLPVDACLSEKHRKGRTDMIRSTLLSIETINC